MSNHVYLLDTQRLEDPGYFALWYGRMPRERREKIDRCRFAKDRRLSLGAGILLQRVLRPCGAEEGALRRGENGKPFLPDGDGLCFNLSHSGHMAACAVSDRPVGVDIQARRQFGEKLIRYVFLEPEIDWVRARCPDADAGFTSLWTVKESVMKYWGTGLSLAAKRICLSPGEPLRVRCEGRPCEALRFTRFDIPGYALTVCSEDEPFTAQAEWVEI